MKLFSLILVSALVLLAAGAPAADSTIHGLTLRTPPTGVESIPVDVETSPGVWHNYRLLTSELIGTGSTPAPIIINVYTNISYYSASYYMVTTNFNVYSNITVQYLLATNIYSTNAYVEYFTNNYEITTNLYVTNAYVAYLTNVYAVVSNLFVTNAYIQFLTNQYLITTNLYATNSYIQYLTNQYLITTNLYATNTYLQFLTNQYEITTNLYATNSYIEYLTNDYLITTNLYATNTIIQNLTNFYTVAGTVALTNMYLADVAWSGPTNLISYTNGSVQSYTTLVPVNVTNIYDEVAGYANQCLLCVTNQSSTNIGFWVPSVYFVAAGQTNGYSVTNGNVAEAWFLSSKARKTVIFQQFKSQ